MTTIIINKKSDLTAYALDLGIWTTIEEELGPCEEVELRVLKKTA